MPIRNCGRTIARLVSASGDQTEDFILPLTETLPGVNLLLSGGTVESYTLFIAAFCRIFAITE